MRRSLISPSYAIILVPTHLDEGIRHFADSIHETRPATGDDWLGRRHLERTLVGALNVVASAVVRVSVRT